MKDEFDWIKSITPSKHFQSSLIEGIGDDAALVRTEAGMDDILCVDTMVESVHFSRQTMTPYHIGYKALAVNISDVAAMGGAPKFYLVSIGIPDKWSESELQQIYQGMAAIAETYEVDLIGGDTVSTKGPLVISVTIVGRVQEDRKLLRKNARPGDIVFLTGPVGVSAAGLECLLNDEQPSRINKKLIRAHQMPMPQVEAGLLLSESGYRIALNDISDGLASEAHEIAEASQVGIKIDAERLPTIQEFRSFSKAQVLDWMLYGGEDFQLVGTVSSKDWQSLKKLFDENDQSIYRIGEVIEGPSMVKLIRGKEVYEIEKKGFNHFK
ncbi:thiamine-phosphate kinase [Pseudalkalibacillus sp. SCS-8]|uniref:thiamine-phosphate kinase n=1 Tax=Pseudalkalibacillus nanhaiensis TaxID=3115291 RepID=UPI0032DA38CB